MERVKGYYHFNRGNSVEYYFYYNGNKVVAKTSYLDEGKVIWKLKANTDNTDVDYFFDYAVCKLNAKQMKLKGMPLYQSETL